MIPCGRCCTSVALRRVSHKELHTPSLLMHKNPTACWTIKCLCNFVCAFSQNLTAAEVDSKIIMLKQAMAHKLN